MLLLPGSTLQAWLAFDSRRGPIQTVGGALSAMADSTALSIALSSLLAMALFFAGVYLPSTLVSGLYGACLAVYLAALIWGRVIVPVQTNPVRTAAVWLLGALFLAALVGWRLYQARALVLPAWVDSVHHTLIVRLIMEQGGLPQDFSPYIQAPFFYHYGFHLITALFAGWAGISADQAVLWFGQVLNAAVALSVYRLGSALYTRINITPPDGSVLTGRILSAAPVVAALLVGFVFQMPAYYLTWGRYTLLAGLLLAGPAAAAALEAWDEPDCRAHWVRLALLVAGLVLTHYFVLLMVGLFLILIGAAALWRRLRGQMGWKFLWRLAAAAGLGLLITAPWLWRVWTYNQRLAGVQFVSVDAGEAAWKSALDYLRYLMYVIGPRRNHILLALAGVGMLVALRRPRLWILAGWGLLMALLSLPWGPRLNPFRPDHFAIVLFFPASLLLAALLVEAAAAAERVFRPWAGVALLALTAGALVFWGMRDTRSIINAVTVIGNRADVSALEWINENIPEDARFYTNTAKWQGQAYRGVDGGYWLVPYTGRAGLIPPVFYGWGPPEYVEQITRLSAAAAAIKDCTPEFWTLVRETHLTHVYVRKGRGSLQPEVLANCANLREIYQAGGVFLYEILP